MLELLILLLAFLFTEFLIITLVNDAVSNIVAKDSSFSNEEIRKMGVIKMTLMMLSSVFWTCYLIYF